MNPVTCHAPIRGEQGRMFTFTEGRAGEIWARAQTAGFRELQRLIAQARSGHRKRSEKWTALRRKLRTMARERATAAEWATEITY